MLQKEDAGTKSQQKAQLWSKPTYTYIINKPNSKNPHETTSNHQEITKETMKKESTLVGHNQKTSKPLITIKEKLSLSER